MSALAFLVAGKTECAFIVRREVQFLQKKPQLLLRKWRMPVRARKRLSDVALPFEHRKILGNEFGVP
jgi:hypothetical protein